MKDKPAKPSSVKSRSKKKERDWTRPQAFPKNYVVPEGIKVSLLTSINKDLVAIKTGVTVEKNVTPLVRWVRGRPTCAMSHNLAPENPTDHPDHPDFGKVSGANTNETLMNSEWNTDISEDGWIQDVSTVNFWENPRRSFEIIMEDGVPRRGWVLPKGRDTEAIDEEGNGWHIPLNPDGTMVRTHMDGNFRWFKAPPSAEELQSLKNQIVGLVSTRKSAEQSAFSFLNERDHERKLREEAERKLSVLMEKAESNKTLFNEKISAFIMQHANTPQFSGMVSLYGYMKLEGVI